MASKKKIMEYNGHFVHITSHTVRIEKNGEKVWMIELNKRGNAKNWDRRYKVRRWENGDVITSYYKNANTTHFKLKNYGFDLPIDIFERMEADLLAMEMTKNGS